MADVNFVINEPNVRPRETYNPQPGTDNQQPATSNRQPATNSYDQRLRTIFRRGDVSNKYSNGAGF